MKKRIILLLFLTIIVFSVSSCGKKGKYECVNDKSDDYGKYKVYYVLCRE